MVEKQLGFASVAPSTTADRPIMDTMLHTIAQGRPHVIAGIIHECRCETAETDARRGFSQVKPTQAS